jgi:aminobenzoyl-glutamate transport protein
LGTVIAKMVPFVVPFWVAWVLVLSIFYAFGIPLGPGVGVRIGE